MDTLVSWAQLIPLLLQLPRSASGEPDWDAADPHLLQAIGQVAEHTLQCLPLQFDGLAQLMVCIERSGRCRTACFHLDGPRPGVLALGRCHGHQSSLAGRDCAAVGRLHRSGSTTMSRTTAIPTLHHRMQALLAASQAESTRNGYASDLRHYRQHGGALPAKARDTGQSVALIIKRMATAVWGEESARDYAGHSLRAGFCTQAALLNWPGHWIRQQSRHQSEATLARYIRPGLEGMPRRGGL